MYATKPHSRDSEKTIYCLNNIIAHDLVTSFDGAGKSDVAGMCFDVAKRSDLMEFQYLYYSCRERGAGDNSFSDFAVDSESRCPFGFKFTGRGFTLFDNGTAGLRGFDG